MSWVVSVFRSAIVKKAVMAVTGVALFGFVLGHMLGNLKIYLGSEDFNHYAEWLREMGSPALPHGSALWIARAGLLAAVLLHMLSAWQVTRLSHASRPLHYRKLGTQAATYASRTMRWGGVIIALFVVYHLAHLTFGWSWAHPNFVAGDPYQNLVAGFSVWWVAALYMVAQLALGLHLYHGVWSLFQSLGWNHPRFNEWRKGLARVFAIIVTVGNLSFPLAVLSGVVR